MGWYDRDRTGYHADKRWFSACPSVVEGRQLASRLGQRAVKIIVTATVGDDHAAEFSLLYRSNRS